MERLKRLNLYIGCLLWHLNHILLSEFFCHHFFNFVPIETAADQNFSFVINKDISRNTTYTIVLPNL